MSNAYRLYFVVMYALLRVPLLRRLALTIHMTSGTYRASLRDGVSSGSRIAAYWRAYRRIRRNRRSAGARRAVLMVYEPRFRWIIEELGARGIDVLFLGRGLFDYLFQVRLAAYLADNKRGFGEYALNAYERYMPDRRRYLADCAYLATLLRRAFRPTTIILPKYNDDYTLEMVQAFDQAGWRPVVYDREGTVTRKRLDHVPPIVARMAVGCRAVVAYNETHREFFRRVFRLADMAPPELVIMGNPASDDWFRDPTLADTRPRRNDGKDILYFAFGEFSYVYDTDYLKGRNEVWRALLTDIHDVLAEHLREHRNDQLLYKRGAKGNRDYWEGSTKVLSLENATLLPNTANANRLIANSDVVIAFQTTALIDAMHTDKVLIYCAWGDRYEELKSGLIDFEQYAREGAILHARSPAEFRRLLTLSPDQVPLDLAARKRIRESFTTNPDGSVARRFADWVESSIAGPANTRPNN